MTIFDVARKIKWIILFVLALFVFGELFVTRNIYDLGKEVWVHTSKLPKIISYDSGDFDSQRKFQELHKEDIGLLKRSAFSEMPVIKDEHYIMILRGFGRDSLFLGRDIISWDDGLQVQFERDDGSRFIESFRSDAEDSGPKIGLKF